MKSVNADERRRYTAARMIDGWKVHIVTYRIGDRYYCTIDNVDPGARFARAEGATREEVERAALEKAKKYLGQTRKFPAHPAERYHGEFRERFRALASPAPAGTCSARAGIPPRTAGTPGPPAPAPGAPVSATRIRLSAARTAR